MAHFAELDENNCVVRVIVVNNNELLDKEGNESEAKGLVFCNELLGGRWIQTSYNASIRKNYAGIGYTYDEALDAFIPIKPYNSWILNEIDCQWYAPISYPTDGNQYKWNEQSISWEIISE